MHTAVLFNQPLVSKPCARPWTKIKHKVFTQEAGAEGASRAGGLELEQSNSASLENEFLKTVTGAFWHPWRTFARGAAAAGGSGQGSIRSLRQLCRRFLQGLGSAGSREPQRAGNGQELRIAAGRPGAASSSLAPLATCLLGRACPGSAGNRERLESRRAKSSRSLAGGNASSRIFQHMRQHLFV